MNEQPREKLKPVVFVKGMYTYHAQDKFKQNLLLKALQITTDPRKLKQMIGVKSVAEVYRTLDKLAIRKEYHQALAVHGLDLPTIVDGIKSICEGSGSDSVRLKGWQTLLRSLGLDRYDEQLEKGGVGWEDMVLKMMEENQKNKAKELKEPEVIDYKVTFPETPEEEKRKIEEEEAIGKDLYE